MWLPSARSHSFSRSLAGTFSSIRKSFSFFLPFPMKMSRYTHRHGRIRAQPGARSRIRPFPRTVCLSRRLCIPGQPSCLWGGPSCSPFPVQRASREAPYACAPHPGALLSPSGRGAAPVWQSPGGNGRKLLLRESIPHPPAGHRAGRPPPFSLPGNLLFPRAPGPSLPYAAPPPDSPAPGHRAKPCGFMRPGTASIRFLV